MEKVMTSHSKNFLTWCISMYHVIALKQTPGIKNATLKLAKKFVDVAVYIYWKEKDGTGGGRALMARFLWAVGDMIDVAPPASSPVPCTIVKDVAINW